MAGNTMTRFNLIAMALATALLLGCHKKEVSEHDKMEAANAFSDAQFALSIKDLPRAEAGFQKAAEIVPDNADYQFNLGIAEVKLGKKSDAKGPYKAALAIYQAAYKKDNTNTAAAQQILFILLLLHENDDAKAFLSDLVKAHPENTGLAKFQSSGGVDKLADQPMIKDLAL